VLFLLLAEASRNVIWVANFTDAQMQQNAVSQTAEQGQQQQLNVPSCKSLPDSCSVYKNSGYACCRLKIIPLYIVTY
jgi:hypothetical protein